MEFLSGVVLSDAAWCACGITLRVREGVSVSWFGDSSQLQCSPEYKRPTDVSVSCWICLALLSGHQAAPPVHSLPSRVSPWFLNLQAPAARPLGAEKAVEGGPSAHLPRLWL